MAKEALQIWKLKNHYTFDHFFLTCLNLSLVGIVTFYLQQNMDPKCYLALVGSLCCVDLFDMPI